MAMASCATAALVFCAESLAYYKVPSHWEVRSEPLPRNATGKLLRNVLTGDAALDFVEE